MMNAKSLVDILIRVNRDMVVRIDGKNVDNINISVKENIIDLQSEGGSENELS